MPRAASPPYGKYAWDGAVIFELSGLVFKEPRIPRDRTPLNRGKLRQLSAQGTVGCMCVHEAGMPHYCAAVNCYNLSNKVRLSFFRFPKEADRYSNVDFETPDIYKKNVLS
jgi:hypothetical protein